MLNIQSQKRTKSRLGLIFVSPLVIGILIFVRGPVIFSFILSFFYWDILSPMKWAGLENYIWFLEDTDEFEVILSHLKEMKMIKDFRIGINPKNISEIEFSSKIFEGHIIEKPDEYDCWNSFILDNSLVGDRHMSKVAHDEFAKHLYNLIKNKKKI